MKLFVIFIALSFAAKQSDNVAGRDENNGRAVNDGEKDVLVKIEEDEYAKKKETSSQFIGVGYDPKRYKWVARRQSKLEKKLVHNGGYYNEETAAHASDTLARKLMAKGEESHKLNFPDDDTEVFPEAKTASSHFIGVTYNVNYKKWQAHRHSKLEKKRVYSGCYDNERAAAHASDTLARKLIANGEQSHKLNFPDDETEVLPKEKTASSHFIGVSFHVCYKKWQAHRHSKLEKKMVYNGCYDDEETAAHASDTLARKITGKGEQGHKLNFPDDETEVLPKEKTASSQYIGVSHYVNYKSWRANRRSKLEKKLVYNGCYDNEQTAAHASDTLARKLLANGEQGHKLNFPDDETEVLPKKRPKKRKRSNRDDLSHPKND